MPPAPTRASCAGVRPVLDHHRDVLHLARRARRDLVERVGDHLFERSRRDLDHRAGRYRASARNSPLHSRRARPYDAEAGEHRSGAGSATRGSRGRRAQGRTERRSRKTGSGAVTEPNGTTPGRRGSRRPQPRPSTWGNPGARVRKRSAGDGPEEIEAATQRRLLGAFCCSGLRRAGGCDPMSVVPGRYGAARGRARSTVSTPPSATRSPARAAPLAILAGAGSGKTRVLTRRIAWQSREQRIDPAHVLAVTFTRKAAGELRSRLASPRRARVGHRRHVPRHRARPAAAPRRRAGPRHARASSNARSGSWCRCCPSAGARARCSPPSWRRRSSGPRPGW